MRSAKLVVLHPGNKGNRIPVHLMYPLLRSQQARETCFCGTYAAALRAISQNPSAVVCVFGMVQRFENGTLRNFTAGELQRLRDCVKQLIYFDTSPSARRFQVDVLALCDRYVKQSLLRDTGQTRQRLIDAAPDLDVDRLLHDTVRLGWNVGYGLYPRTVATKRLPPILERLFGVRHCLRLWPTSPSKISNPDKKPLLHARFTVDNDNRRQLTSAARRLGDAALVGKVGRRQYNQEIRTVRSVLSPFGASEVCYRDFEAAQYGAVLLKPDMSHLLTWPDIYQDEQFLKIAGNGSDLERVFEVSLSASASDYTDHAFSTMRAAYQQIDQRVSEVLGV